jgi:hypothetical protein
VDAAAGQHFRRHLLLRRARILDAEPTVSATQNRMRAWQEIGHVLPKAVSKASDMKGHAVGLLA